MAGIDGVINGVLPVDKPAGPTSHDVVAIARRALRTRRIGHTGTLDPFATGLLLLCVGPATRIAAHLSGMDKRYHATVRLGIVTDTDDNTGTVVAERDPAAVELSAVERALDLQRGPIEQVPPAYSAKKKEGRRAYSYARAGVALTLAPVSITIRELRVVRWDMPFVELDVLCSSGTYIRAIARDLGEQLGVGGHLTSLRRTAIGPVCVDGALPLEQLPDEAAVAGALLAPLTALADMPRVDVGEDEVVHIRHGRSIAARANVTGTVALASQGQLLALARADADAIRPNKVFE